MFSKSSQYAIRAAIYLVKQMYDGRKAGQHEIAAAIDSPAAFTSKILQKMAKAGVISSLKGPTGGFYVNAKQADAGRLWDIIYAIDGDSLFVNCTLGLQKCNAAKPCPLHDKFVNIRKDIRHTLENTSLATLAEDVSGGTVFLKR